MAVAVAARIALARLGLQLELDHVVRGQRNFLRGSKNFALPLPISSEVLRFSNAWASPSGMLQPWCGLRGLKSRDVPVPIGLWRKKVPPIILEYANENHPNLGFWASKLSDASLNFPNHGVVAAHFRAA